MPLNLSNRDQNSGHLFYRRRLRAAITRFSVRMKHDDRKFQAALSLSMVLVLLGCGWMALLHVIKPAGRIGQATIVGNRDTGALYARIDGRLHPALNLTSARLLTGIAANPTWVTGGEIDKYPTGPLVGIPGLPDSIGIGGGNTLSAWAVCDTASGRETTVTAIAGQLSNTGRAVPLRDDQAVLGVHAGATHLVWNGHRTPVNLADRAVTLTLGLDHATPRPVPLSNALFDAIPATEPLVVPQIPEWGTPSRWLPDATVGQVLVIEGLNGEPSGFFVLLPTGVQKITGFVADLLRTAGRQGVGPPRSVSPATVAGIPEVDVINVGFYPTGRMAFVDTAANPVTCLSWNKNSGDPRATTTLLTGRGLPTPPDLDGRITPLVRDDRRPDSVEAQRVLVLPGAATFVAATGGAPESATREALYWVSQQGVRYGIDADEKTLQALGLDPRRAVQAPWPVLRILAAGPIISRTDAMVARDTITPTGAGGPVGPGE